MSLIDRLCRPLKRAVCQLFNLIPGSRPGLLICRLLCRLVEWHSPKVNESPRQEVTIIDKTKIMVSRVAKRIDLSPNDPSSGFKRLS